MNDFIVVYSAEFLRRIRSRPYQIGFIVGILGIYAMAKLPSLMVGGMLSAGSGVVVAGAPSLTAPAAKALAGDFKIVATKPGLAPPAIADLKGRDAAFWVTLARSKSGLDVTIYSDKAKSDGPSTIAGDLAPLNVQLGADVPAATAASLVDLKPRVVQLSTKFSNSKDATATWAVAYTLIMFLYVLILVNSQLVMSSVAEEKTSRIAELLVASISPVALLYGKVASAATLAVLQMVVWIGFAILLGIAGSGSHAAAAPSGPDIGVLLGGSLTLGLIAAFVALFVLGFLQLSLLFAGMGSLINRTEDLGSISAPLIIPVVAALLVSMAALGNPDATWVVALSFVPIFSPFVLFARIAMTDVPTLQLVLAFAVNVAAVIAISAIAGKLYRIGMLLYGRAPNLKQVWQVIRS